MESSGASLDSGKIGSPLVNEPCNEVEDFKFSNHRDPDSDEFQELICSSLSTDMSLAKCSLRSDQ